MSIRNALYFSISSQLIIKLINLVLIVTLARLLSPSELGIYAIAAGFTLIFSEIKNLGASAYIIKTEALNEDLLRLCLGLSIIISWAIGFLFLINNNNLSTFYNIPDLKSLISFISISFFVSPFLVVPLALLIKRLSFKKLFLINICSELVLLISTFYFAFTGSSFHSIVYGSICGILFKLISTYFTCQQDMFFIPKFKGMTSIIRFGLHVSITNLLNRIALILPDLIIGKLRSPRETAIFSRALGFAEFIRNSIEMGITPVTLPYFSNCQNQSSSLTAQYLFVISIYGSICWPILLMSTIVSEPIINLFFGTQWVESSELLPSLVIYVFFRSLYPFSNAFLIIKKQEKLNTIRAILHFTLVLIAVILGVTYSLTKISNYIMVVGIIDFIFMTYLLKKYAQITPMGYWNAIKKNVLLIILCLLGIKVLDIFLVFELMTTFTFFITFSISTLILWFAGIFILNMDIAIELRSLIQKIKAAKFLK